MMRVYVEALEAPRLCPCCGGDRLRSKGRYERRVRHLACFGHRSELVIVNARQPWTHFRPSRIDPPPGELLAGGFWFKVWESFLFWVGLEGDGAREEAGLAFFPHAVGVALDVDDGGAVKEAVQGG